MDLLMDDTMDGYDGSRRIVGLLGESVEVHDCTSTLCDGWMSHVVYMHARKLNITR